MSEEILTTQNDSAEVETKEAAPEEKKKVNLFSNPIFKCVIVLTLIAVVAGTLLGVVNYFTYVDPDAVIIEQVADYFQVDASQVAKNEAKASFDNIKACYVATDKDGNIVGYCYYSVGTGAKDGTLELLVYIDGQGVIKELAVYSQGETAGYFDKVEKQNKSKYIGLDLDDVSLVFDKKGKLAADPGVVAAVSSATYTSTGYHNAVAAAANAYKNGKEVA